MAPGLDPKYMARLYREQAKATDDKITAIRLGKLADEFDEIAVKQGPSESR